MLTIKRTSQFRERVASLRDERAKGRIASRLARIQFGNFGDVKSIGSGIMEARIDYGPGYRLYFVRRGAEVIVLLCGGDKASQRRDIKVALVLAASV